MNTLKNYFAFINSIFNYEKINTYLLISFDRLFWSDVDGIKYLDMETSKINLIPSRNINSFTIYKVNFHNCFGIQ